LAVGKGYKLTVEVKKAKIFWGIIIKEREEKLVLRDAKTKKVVYEQEVEK
jgi:hypothetical protein